MKASKKKEKRDKHSSKVVVYACETGSYTYFIEN